MPTKDMMRFWVKKIALSGMVVVLLGCTAANQRSGEVAEVQSQYGQVVSIAQQYRAGEYGQPEPDSLPRLKRYQAQAYQDVLAFHDEVVKTKQISQEKKIKALRSIYVMKSYLAALGATSAYEQ
ncbi:hypothetical protein [Entomobacter blattae]|uniref:Lipoprotein n=1 Tax=Entomobacter blattae TaxID=2762277 RepID=A0A7H1NS43_9PROT|nr:hypothetical protein [Entomobacter blattae]QNT78603.1 hypothetical protein JGUZn3_13770 [Entomobacter blattae]